MRKAELEQEVARLRVQNQLYKNSLVKIRQIARDCIHNNTQINHVWIIEEITSTIAHGAEK